MASVSTRIRFWLASMLVLLPLAAGAANVNPGAGIGGPITGPRPITPISPYDPVLIGITTLESRLGFIIIHPLLVFDNGGTLNYTAGGSPNGGLMQILSDPLAIQLTPAAVPFAVLPFAGDDFLSLSLVIDETTGEFVEGVPGDDFQVVGQADINNDGMLDVGGVLLTGEVVEYMGEDSGGSTDFHDFRVRITGGELAYLYTSGQIGINLTSEMSNFDGSYTQDFAGESKGTLGRIPCKAVIGNFVWIDTNQNGIQDPGEPGIPDVELILTDEFGGVQTTTTNVDGEYKFADLCKGTYTIEVNDATIPPGLDPTLINAPGSTQDNDSNDPDGTTVVIPADSGEDLTYDFGYIPVEPAALGDFVWLDSDMDGFQDPGEPGIEGVMVNLYTCGGAFVGTMVTDINGFYFFNDLAPGCYQVEFILPPGLVFSPMDNAADTLDSDPDPTTGFTDPVNLAPGEVNPDVDAGMFPPPPPAELGDRFWLDENGNGIQDPGEPGIPGVPVDLIDCTTGAVLDSTTTDATGMYLFTNLGAGCYQVQFTAPQDCEITGQDEGSDDTVDNDADASGLTGQVNLALDESNLTVDGGCYFTAGLGDFVWLDEDMDGFQDPGEVGIPDVFVELLDADMLPTGMSTTTGPAGEYQFLNLDPGSYFVQFTAPAGLVFTVQDAAADDVDSDANGTGKTDKITLSSGEFDPTIDAGLFPPPIPDINLEKSTNTFDADFPTGPFVQNGGDVLWEYFVTNTGNTDLFDVVVVDSQGVMVTCPQDTLVMGEMMTCVGNGTGTVDQYMNLGSVCGTDGTTEVCDDDPSHYFGCDASIEIEKLTNGEDADFPTGPYITPGDAVTWTYVVTNTGNVDLSNIMVTDDQGVTVTCPLDTLIPDQTMDCVGNGIAVAGQYANNATVTGEPPPDCDPVNDEDPSHYFGALPDIDIEKLTNDVDADDPNAGDAPQIMPGDTVTWTYIVTNTGNVTLNDIAVIDNQGVTVTCPDTTLEPDDSFECTASGLAEDLLNTVFETVPGLCGGFPNTPLYENIGLATGESVNGEFVEDADPSHYCNPPTPDIDIEKLTNGVDADDPNAGDAPQIAAGDTVTWTYIVTNTGNVPLDNVSVTDDQGVSVSCPATTLNPGDSFECTASGVADDLLTTGFTTVPGLCGGYSDTQLYENMGTATGETSNGDFVEDVDASHYCNPPTPDIDIEKATNGVDADDPNAGDAPQIAAGDTVTWTYLVTNTGNVPLSNVNVTDDQGVAVSCPATTLNPGDSFTCTASGVADDLLTTGFTTVPGLCGGYSDTQLYENMGTASGETSNGDFVEDVDASHYCNPPTPDIDIEKATNGVDADDPNAGDAPQIAAGDTVTWTYLVTNTGNVPLSNVNVTDDQGVAVSCPATTLNPGDSFTCTASGVADDLMTTGFTTVPGLCGGFPTMSLYENMGTATGETSNGDFVRDVDASHYCNPPMPDIHIEKATNGVDADDANAGDAPQIMPGDPVTWTYMVTNTGNVPLTNVVVMDNQFGQVTCSATALAPGESFTCSANGFAEDLMNTGLTTVPGLCGAYPNTPLYENIGTATGETSNGAFVQDADASHYCNPPTPDIDIEKATNGIDADDPNAGDAPQIAAGDTVTWTYLVTNTGDVPLSNVNVTDDQGVSVTCPATTLNPGDSFTCTASGVADDLMTTGFTTVLGLCGIRPNTPLYENMGTATGSTVGGDFVQDVDPSHYCNPEPCALEVSKTCFIPMPAPNDYVCDKPIDSLTMIWDGSSPVRIKAWKGPVGSQLLADIDDIQPGEEITVMGYAGSPNDVTWEVFTAGTSNKIGESMFHLSCSDSEMNGPEDCGMNEGNGKSNDSGLINLWLLEGIVDAGGVLDCTTPSTGDQTECEFQAYPASCETGDVDFLTLQYTGGGCGASDNAQDDHVCSGNVDGNASATFTDDDGNSVTLNPGDTVTIARNLAKNMTLTNAGGTETNELHTSCSQPIQAGDIYGSLTLVQIDGQGIGTDVNYSYVITNSSNVDIVSLSAIDVPLGPIPGAPSSLNAGESVTLNASAFIIETTTNIAIVDGLTADGQMCNGQASSTVTILPPPPCEIDGEGLFDHFHSDHVYWKLTNNGASTATVESIMLSWPAANGDIIEVKLNGTIFNGNLPPTSGTLDSDDFVGNLSNRQIAPGDTKTLELKFDNNIVGSPADYSITVNFEEGCSVTFENTGLPFTCTDKITELNMSWDGAADPVRVKAYKGSVGSQLVLDQSGIGIGDEIFVTGLAGAPNDVFWEIFSGGTKIGESKFHLSCSDSEMNGAEDCGNREGNGKGNDANFINDWILEGLTDGDGPFDCSNLP